MSFSAWLALATVCTLGAMSPGPSLAVVIRQTVRGSRRHGVVTALSHGAAVGVYAVLVLLGLGALFNAIPLLAELITYLGAAFLAWIGIRSLFFAHGGGVAANATGQPRAPLRDAAREGFLVAFLNPKLAVFFMALFAQFVVPGQTLGSQVLMAVTAWLIDSLWYLLVVIGLSQPRWLPWLRRNGVWIDRLTGVLLIALAIRVLTL